MATRRELEQLFRPEYRELTQAEKDQMARIKQKAFDLAVELNPTDTRQKSIALTKLQECVFWAVHGITG